MLRNEYVQELKDVLGALYGSIRLFRMYSASVVLFESCNLKWGTSRMEGRSMGRVIEV